MTRNNNSEYQLSFRISGDDFSHLSDIARADQRPLETVALVLLRHVIKECHGVGDFRRILDEQTETAPPLIPAPLPPGNRGIIAELQQLLLEGKENKFGFTAEELHQKLIERCGTASMITVRAQLSRLPSEKDFQIRKIRDGRLTRYMAE